MTSNGVPTYQPPDPALDTMAGFPDPFPPPDPIRFPNTRRRASASATRGRTNAPDTNPSDPDTCRICRGEGSPDEPLFYPCKCSGSIKYVHQDCLMEWLSHSQKKHCELCKTPFRFTKLYDPNMPKTLPTHIFVSHTTKYLFRNLLAWMRAALVVSVWLVCLPYFMRSVWSCLVWISDEGLGGRSALSAAAEALDLLAGAPYGSNMCPSSPLFAATTTPATVGGVIDSLPPESARIVKGLYGINLTSSDPIYSTVLRLLFGNFGLPEKPAAALSNTTGPLPSVSRHQTLLGGVGFLRNFTRYTALNRFIIAVLEGQIITVLVIACFILIILVRDYVVQQQPEINMRAAFAAVEIPPQAAHPEAAHAEGPRLEAEMDEEPFEQVPDEPANAFHETDTADEHGSPILRRQLSDSPESSARRPPLPNMAPTGHARPIHDFDRATVHEYLDIYREAGGDPESILRIARERNLEGRLDYWVRLTRSMMDRQRESESLDSDQAGPSGAVDIPGSSFQPASEFGEAADKGKGKLVEDLEEDGVYSMGNLLRPRAHTDGPPVNNTINPLANNSWSFTDIPAAPPYPDALYPDPFFPREPEDSYAFPPEPEDSNTSWETPDFSNGTRPSSPVIEDLNPAAEAGPFVPQEPTETQEASQPEPPRRGPAGLVGRVADFMWRQVDEIDEADLAPINSLGDFAREEPDEEAQGNAPPNQNGGNQEMADAAAAADAVDDAEDLEGILELLGIRGPVAGLFQNAIFCAFLVSMTLFIGVFIPYNIGRVTIWALANPARLARMLFSLSKFVQDCALLLLGLAFSTMSESVRVLSRALMLPSLAEYSGGVVNASWAMAASAASRIGSSVLTELPLISASEVRNFSAISHEALFVLRDHVVLAFTTVWRLLDFVLCGGYAVKGAQLLAVAANISRVAWGCLKSLPTAMLNPSSWVLNLSLPETTRTINPELAYWGALDRFWAVLAGYVALSLLAGLYLRRGTPFSSSPSAQEWEASLIDGLNQASGVMKVILIISIEMLVFPLYCGMLLDAALLPLFENTTLKSRVLFTVNFPVTSIFVHWFIGTGYMFHFALFVSMCRKIMRKGVLYFIRDPDDPEFHPVRDVLERNLTTQLRKILFSAFVYGALVIVCLGGVVWGLSLSLPSVLPIHYSSNEPVLEFPIDLLFYNFLMPFAVRFFKPSHGLHAMYTWWFRRCARALRITWFLFGERRIDEEGQLALKPDSPDRNLPYLRQLFLEVDAHGNVVARTWRGIFEGGAAKRPAMKQEYMMLYNVRKASLVHSGQLIPDGRFVRTPASDQVKIPKGGSVFLPVNENNRRQDGLADRPETDIYSSKQYQLVYVPPHFRIRVFLFILFIWIFAAVTGVSITIVPLVFGRWMFGRLIPGHIRTNDVYAFSIGIHILGLAAYVLFHAPTIYGAVKERAMAVAASVWQRDGVRKVFRVVARIAGVTYAYFFVLVVFPLLIASLMELYALLPLHQVMYSAVLKPGFAASLAAGTIKEANPVHTTRVVQAWTIGLLYLKLGTRITNTWFRGGHVSNAARAVLRRGWLNPDISILTRSFILPGLVISVAAMATPLLVAKVAIAEGLGGFLIQEFGNVEGPPDQALYDACSVLIYRMAFPTVALAIASAVGLWGLVGVFRSWQMRIRDEAYLIGERLHNFGATNAPRARGAWRAGGARL
jgi:E3 ubiquitin-protein ligase MARCH6